MTLSPAAGAHRAPARWPRLRSRAHAVGLVCVVLVGSQCDPGPPQGDGGTSDVGLDGSVDAGIVTRLLVSMPGSSFALSCQQGMVLTVGSGGRTPVSDDLPVQIDGGRWLTFYESTNCQGPPVTSLVVPAGQSERMFSVRLGAYGSFSVNASSPGLTTGTATPLATAEVNVSDTRVIVPLGGCFPGFEVRTVVPGSTTEVMAGTASRFIISIPGSFGGAATGSGCFNNQFDVDVAEGASRGATYFSSTASRGTSGFAQISPLLPAGATVGTLRATLFTECLPAGESCGATAACCGAACAGGICP